MISFCKNLNRQMQGVTKGAVTQFSLTHETTTDRYFTRPIKGKGRIPIVNKQERVIIRSGGRVVLIAEKHGKKIKVISLRTSSDTVLGMDETGAFRQEFDGTPFEKVKGMLSFGEFKDLILWLVSAGYYFRKTDKPIGLEEVSGMELSYPHGEGMALGTGNLEKDS